MRGPMPHPTADFLLDGKLCAWDEQLRESQLDRIDQAFGALASVPDRRWRAAASHTMHGHAPIRASAGYTLPPVTAERS